MGCGTIDTSSGTSRAKLPHPSRFESTKNRAQNGDRVSQYQLGQMYWNALGTTRNKDPALLWLKRSAQNGYPPAQHVVGVFYFSGDKVGSPMPLNQAEARRWLLKSAENGYSESYFMLGSFYMEGIGGPIDLDKAEHWLNKAKDVNDPNAAKGIRELKSRKR